MTTTLLLAHPDLKTQRHLWITYGQNKSKWTGSILGLSKTEIGGTLEQNF